MAEFLFENGMKEPKIEEDFEEFELFKVPDLLEIEVKQEVQDEYDTQFGASETEIQNELFCHPEMKEKHETTIPYNKTWQRTPERLPIEILRRLEEAYLAKKYASNSKLWSYDEIRQLSAQLDGLSELNIARWISERNSVARAVEQQKNPTMTASLDIEQNFDFVPLQKWIREKPMDEIFWKNTSEQSKPITHNLDESFTDDEKEDVELDESVDLVDAKPVEVRLRDARQAISDFFRTNHHPSPEDLRAFSDTYGVRYRSIVESLDRKRASKQIVCEPNDSCSRISSYFARESEPIRLLPISKHKEKIVEEILEKIIWTRKCFDIGSVHMLMDLTDLSPTYLRTQYSKWKYRLLNAKQLNYGIEDWKRDNAMDPSDLSLPILRQLEDAYLKKKYSSAEKEWSGEELQRLSEQLDGLSEYTINKWIKIRNDAAKNILPYISPSKRQEMKKGGKRVEYKTKLLLEEFEINPRPDRMKIEDLANTLDMTLHAVRGFFARRRRLMRQATSQLS
ncbi:unnamed protein product [Caenorhabditis sp. 36 PRJEB53466]|nr:unnamed protein product [Caenorhabditis sp. 36 PRJEB53466]